MKKWRSDSTRRRRRDTRSIITSVRETAESLECKTLRLYLRVVIRVHRVKGSWVRRVGRSALRPGLVSRAWEVDRPPALPSSGQVTRRQQPAGNEEVAVGQH